MKPYKIPLVFSLLIFLSAVEANAALVDVSADTLEKWITAGTAFDFILIDIRDTSELTAVIATDACRPYHLSWREGAFVATVNKLSKDAHIFLYCARGNRSGTAGQLLVDSGYVSVYHLVNAPLDRGHLLDLFNMQGRRVVRVKDPFKYSLRYALPKELSGGVYVARLHVAGSRESAVVFRLRDSYAAKPYYNHFSGFAGLAESDLYSSA